VGEEAPTVMGSGSLPLSNIFLMDACSDPDNILIAFGVRVPLLDKDLKATQEQ
tara:strand:- start:87 stop:245 length:159 start_codon:yes stop_codon:yes gene_type:complete